MEGQGASSSGGGTISIKGFMHSTLPELIFSLYVLYHMNINKLSPDFIIMPMTEICHALGQARGYISGVFCTIYIINM